MDFGRFIFVFFLFLVFLYRLREKKKRAGLECRVLAEVLEFIFVKKKCYIAKFGTFVQTLGFTVLQNELFIKFNHFKVKKDMQKSP